VSTKPGEVHFAWDNIQGIDLYSTNPRIQIMNMEAIAFADGTFDAISMSNTFAYAKDPARCLAEAARVLKPGGRFAFGANHVAGNHEWPADLLTAAEVRALLEKASFQIYYEHETAKVNSLGNPQTTVHFGAVKVAADA
jgi:SAM-dependent methyltransferase